MSWAARRRLIIALIIGGVGIAFSTTIFLKTFYEAPSCIDRVQNQDEEGIDCGGSCPYLCTAQEQPPTVLFTKAITNSEGRTDIIASVGNKNSGVAAKNVPYRVQLYSADRVLIKEVTGVLDLPPGATVPIYVPGVLTGKQTITGVFLSIEASSPQWFKMITDSRVIPMVSGTKQSGTVSTPRIETVLANPSAIPLTNVLVIVLVRNDRGDVIAASRTIVATIPAQGQTPATFTWNSAFPSAPTSIEIVPIIPLP